MKLIIPFLACCFTAPAFAGERENLIASIVAAGTNNHEDRKHTVEISGCTMTTYFWHNVEDDGWVLWSSFVFAMQDASFSPMVAATGKPYASFNDGTHIFISFEMQNDQHARHEKSILRPKRGAATPSPRGDGTTHYFEMKKSFFISHVGPGVDQKADRFTKGLTTYAERYCTFIG